MYQNINERKHSQEEDKWSHNVKYNEETNDGLTIAIHLENLIKLNVRFWIMYLFLFNSAFLVHHATIKEASKIQLECIHTSPVYFALIKL